MWARSALRHSELSPGDHASMGPQFSDWGLITLCTSSSYLAKTALRVPFCQSNDLL